MDARKVILEAMHSARAILVHHVQTKHEREPEETIRDLRDILESTEVSEAVSKLRK